MRQIIASLKSVSPYTQGKFHQTPRLEKESNEDYEMRTWKARLHVTEDGKVFIPPMALKNCLSDAAKYLSISIPGKGKNKYTKHFEAGVMVMDPLVLDLHINDVPYHDLFVSARGVRGGDSRVMKRFACIPKWAGDAIFYVFDDTITAEVFRYHLEQAGKFIGIGVFRPRKNGYFGRFDVVDILVQDGD